MANRIDVASHGVEDDRLAASILSREYKVARSVVAVGERNDDVLQVSHMLDVEMANKHSVHIPSVIFRRTRSVAR